MRVRSLGQKSPWRRAWQPTLVFLSGESHGQRRLEGYSPQSHKELTQMKTEESSKGVFSHINEVQVT